MQGQVNAVQVAKYQGNVYVKQYNECNAYLLFGHSGYCEG